MQTCIGLLVLLNPTTAPSTHTGGGAGPLHRVPKVRTRPQTPTIHPSRPSTNSNFIHPIHPTNHTRFCLSTNGTSHYSHHTTPHHIRRRRRLNRELVRQDQDWVPEGIGYSIYLRPTAISTYVRTHVYACMSAHVYPHTSARPLVTSPHMYVRTYACRHMYAPMHLPACFVTSASARIPSSLIRGNAYWAEGIEPVPNSPYQTATNPHPLTTPQSPIQPRSPSSAWARRGRSSSSASCAPWGPTTPRASTPSSSTPTPPTSGPGRAGWGTPRWVCVGVEVCV